MPLAALLFSIHGYIENNLFIFYLNLGDWKQYDFDLIETDLCWLS